MSYYMSTKQTITETLRRAVNESELTFLGLEQQTGLTRQSLMKFARGEQSLRLDKADKLAEFFGFEIVRRRKRKVK